MFFIPTLRSGALVAAILGLPAAGLAETIERPKVGGYAYSIYLVQDPNHIGEQICVKENGMKGWSISNALPVVAGTEEHPNIVISCESASGQLYSYYFQWQVACPNSPTTYSLTFPNIPQCLVPADKPRQCGNECGNPINFATGQKIRRETDYIGLGELKFTRIYTGASSGRDAWSHNFSRQVGVSTPLIPANMLKFSLVRQWWDGGNWVPPVPQIHDKRELVNFSFPEGRILFTRLAGSNGWFSDSDVSYSLETATDSETGAITEYRLTTPGNDVEIYNAKLKLQQIRYRNGRTLSFAYSDSSTPVDIAPSPGLMLSVTDDFGRTLQFRYDANSRIKTFIDPASQEFAYSYDEAENLKSVTYPDGNKRIYLYNEPAFNAASGNPSLGHLMTGIADEVAPGILVRYATFKYSSSGRPFSTELANGVEKYTIDYATNAVTDPMGATRTYGFTELNGVRMRTSVSQPGGAGHGAAVANTLYTSHGEAYEQTDFNQVVTRREFLSGRSGLESRRTMAAGTPEQRIVSTIWHPKLRLPLKIAEPKRITTYQYSASGNLLSETIQATTDSNGSQGFSAVATGTPRTRSFEYNSRGQLLLAKGPRTDIADETRFDYDGASGNLNWVKNALGHVTSFSDYDAHGRARRITSPNGEITTFDYTSRGWLKSRTVTAGGVSRTTTFTYDGVGQMKQLVLPDGVALSYTYDDARRLTGISDSLGNSVIYTLDAMGNRTREETIDPSGTLSRQVAREYDALSRVQMQTGGAQ